MSRSSRWAAAAAAAAAGAGGAGAGGLQACWMTVIEFAAQLEAGHRAHRLLGRLTAIAAACWAGLGRN